MGRRGITHLALLALVAGPLVGFASAGSLSEVSNGISPGLTELPPPPPKSPHPRGLDSSLSQAAAVFRTQGADAARGYAEGRGLKILNGGRADVVTLVETLDSAAFAGGVARRHGGTVLGAYQSLFEVAVPLNAIEALAREASVRSVRPTPKIFPMATSEGVATINASAWHDAGIRGAGAKVAIVDVGFSGYTAKLGSELPASVNTSCSQSTLENGEDHGTAVAEIVYDVAPEAEVYLVSVASVIHIGNAVTCLVAAGVDVVNASIGTSYDGPGNGTGTLNSIVNTATAGGIVWVNSAGNERRSHWAGPWVDADGDAYLEFVPGAEVQAFAAGAGSYIQATLRWNDPWGASCNDYDLYLIDSSLTILDASVNFQLCSGYSPREQINYIASAAGTYYLVVARYSATGTSSFDLMLDSGFTLAYPVAANSLTNPADNGSSGMITVGAFNISTNLHESFSSEGPTTDGRQKPDIAGPDRVTTASYGTGAFAGTSASAPHVAGAAALVKSQEPTFSPGQVRVFLQSQAIDAGELGFDNQFGAGRVWLGAPAAKVDLVMSMTATPDPVPASSNFTFTATLTNLGPSVATGVVVANIWTDAGATFVSKSISSGSCDGPSTLDPRSVWCWPGTIPANGSVTMQIVLTAPASESAVVAMTSSTQAVNQGELNAANNAATADTAVGPALADLSITNSDASDPVTFGAQLTYQLSVTNNGPSPATGVTVTDTLPAGVTFLSATPSQGSCDQGALVSCALGTLTNGANATVQVVVIAPNVLGGITAVATVTGTAADPNIANNSASQGTTPSAFGDLPPTDWAYSQMATLLSRGITTGCYYDAGTGERRYCPNDNVTRAQMAAFLVRALGLTEYANPTPTFSDVPSTYWAYGWIERLYQLGITTGCYYDGVERRYCSENLVPRDQMAVFLMRAKVLTELSSPTPTFSDVPSTYWAYGWIERLYEQAVTTGCYYDGVERRYCPTNNVTRREMAVFIVRNWP